MWTQVQGIDHAMKYNVHTRDAFPQAPMLDEVGLLDSDDLVGVGVEDLDELGKFVVDDYGSVFEVANVFTTEDGFCVALLWDGTDMSLWSSNASFYLLD